MHAHRPAGPRRPVDLGIGRAQVDRLDLAGIDPLLPQRPGVRELHQRRRRRVGVATDLAAEALEDLVAVPQRTVADAQHVLAPREQIGDELVDRADPRLGDLLHPAGHLAVHRVEHLALAGVDHRHDDAVGVPARERQQVERRDADHRDPQRLGDRLGRRQPDAHPGEQPRADVDGDHADLVELDVGLSAHELDRRHECLGVAATAWSTSKSPITPSWPPMATLTRSVAVSMPRISTGTPRPRSTIRLHRPAHVGPTPAISMVRASSLAPAIVARSSSRRRPSSSSGSISSCSRWTTR